MDFAYQFQDIQSSDHKHMKTPNTKRDNITFASTPARSSSKYTATTTSPRPQRRGVINQTLKRHGSAPPTRARSEFRALWGGLLRRAGALGIRPSACLVSPGHNPSRSRELWAGRVQQPRARCRLGAPPTAWLSPTPRHSRSLSQYTDTTTDEEPDATTRRNNRKRREATAGTDEWPADDEHPPHPQRPQNPQPPQLQRPHPQGHPQPLHHQRPQQHHPQPASMSSVSNTEASRTRISEIPLPLGPG